MTRKGKAVGCTGDPRGLGQACPRSLFRRYGDLRRRYPVKCSEDFPVAEEPTPEPAPKDERDLIIEDLKARMDKIESDYQIKIGDYQKANAELWARLHPAKQDPAPPAQPEPVKDPYEVMLDSFDSALGIKKKKE